MYESDLKNLFKYKQEWKQWFRILMLIELPIIRIPKRRTVEWICMGVRMWMGNHGAHGMEPWARSGADARDRARTRPHVVQGWLLMVGVRHSHQRARTAAIRTGDRWSVPHGHTPAGGGGLTAPSQFTLLHVRTATAKLRPYSRGLALHSWTIRN